MKKAFALAVLLLSQVLVWPGRGMAVSPSPVPEESEEKAKEGIREKGEMVCLFESGTVDVRKEIAIGDVLVVFRQDASRVLRPVGKIRIVSYAGANYVRAEVAEGELRTGDVAKRGDAAGLVIFSEGRCK